MKKKSIILCVTLSLIFVLGLFSTSYAFTFSDVEDFEEKYTQVINNAVKDKGYNEKYNAFKNLLSSQIWEQYKNNIPFTTMNNCIVRLQYVSNSNQFRIDIFLWNYETTYKVIQGGTLQPNANISMDYAISFFCSYNATNYILNWERYNDWDWNTNHSSFNVLLTQNNFSLVFIDASIQNDNNYEIIGKNYTIYVIVPNTTTTLVTNVGQYRLGEGFIGNYYYIDRQNISYLIYDNNNNTIQLNEIDYTQVTQGYTTKLYINRQDIISGNTYYIDIYYNNELIQQYGYGNTLIFDIPQGESGDQNINIDLTETNQKLDNIANIIESGEKKAEERQTFWENVYNNLFVLESGEVQEKIDYMIENIKILNSGDSGEIQSIKTILREFEKEPGDFIISWKQINFRNKKIIESGEINFSAETRNNETLSQVMIYVRLIMGYTILIIFAANIWETTLKVLGVGTSIYEDHEEEKARMDNITFDINLNTGAETETRTMRNRGGITTRIHKTRYIGGNKKK